jgi:hypothetical protein
MKRSKLSFNVNARWSFRTIVRLDPPEWPSTELLSPLFTDLILFCEWKVPSKMASKSRGVGGERDFHMSAIISRFLMSVLKT